MPIIEAKCIALHYRQINPVCAYEGTDGGCDADHPSIVRISVLTDGSLSVSTMCLKHSIGERDSAIGEGMICVGQTTVAGIYSDAVLYDVALQTEIAESLGLEMDASGEEE